MNTMRLARLCAGMILMWPALSFGQSNGPGQPFADDKRRLEQEACGAVISADQQRDAGKFEEAVELYSAGMDSYLQLAKTYPSFQASVVQRQSAYCANELRSLLQREDIKERFGEELNVKLDAATPHLVPNASIPRPTTAANSPVAAPILTIQPQNEIERLSMRSNLYAITRPPAKMVVDVKKVAAPRADSTPVIRSEKNEIAELNKKCEALIRQRKDLERKLASMGDAEQSARIEKQTREATEKLLEQVDDENKKLQKDKRDLEEDVVRLEESAIKKAARDASREKSLREKEKAKSTAGGKDSVKTAQPGAGGEETEGASSRRAEVGRTGAVESDGERMTRNVLHEAAGFVRDGRLADAEELLVYGLQKSPGNSDMGLLLGTLYCRARKYDEAVKVLRSLVEKDPTDANARVVLGAALLALGKYGDARMELETAVGFEPDLAEAHYNFSQVLLLTKPADPERAKEEYQLSVKLGGQPDRALEAALGKALAGNSGKGR